MNKQILLTLLALLFAVLTVGAISASDVNVTDSYATSLVDDTSDVSVPLENTAGSSEISVSSNSNVDNDSSKVSLSSEEVLESEDSNNLSTNSTNDNIPSSDDGVAVISSNESDSNVSSTIDVSKTITAKDMSKYYKGSAQYTATFLDAHGNVLNNTNVKITVNGVTYTKQTNANGVAYLAINLKPGSYKVVALNPTTGYSLSTTFKVVSTISASDISKVYTDGKKFTAKFYKSDGKALANKYIKFKINGKTYKVKTNGQGVASLSLINLKKGTYEIMSHNTQDGLKIKNKVKVVRTTTTSLSTKTYTFLKSDSKTVKVNLINKFGYALGKGKIIKFEINGKKYSAKTNANGVAKIKLPSLGAGIYKITYSFAGNSFYKKCSAGSKVEILASKNPTFTVKSTKTFGHGANTKFQVALTSGNVPLAQRTVTLKVDGKNYTKTTDGNGVVSLPIGLDVGNYTISYTYNGESKVNSKTMSTAITVKERSNTSLTWKSGSSYYQGVQTYKVLLKDSNGKVLSGKTVKLTVNSKTYSATTSSSGYALFNANVPTGNYTVSFKYEAIGDNDNAPSFSSTNIEVLKKNTTGYGYWVYGGDMGSVSLGTLASKGTTDLFLNFYALTIKTQREVESWIASANKLGMRVHIWMQAFYANGSWVNPVVNGNVNSDYFEQKIIEAQKYASIKGISGIHLDYIRYPGNAYKTSGGTAAISEFAQQITEAIHDTDPNIIVSCALMPETTSNAYYYGQDYSVISRYMDVVIPMIYKGNYGKTSSWIKTIAKWFVDNSEGAQVWAGLQGYKSDDNVVKLSPSEIAADTQAALDGAASGAVIFRWGVTNFVDFNSLSDQSGSPSITGSVSISDIVAAAYNLNSSIKSSGSIPASVRVGGVTYSTAQFLYLMTKAILYINAGKSSEILAVTSDVASNPTSTVKSGNLYMSEYLDLATRVSSFIESKGVAPNYANSSLGYIKYQSLIDAFARITAFYKVSLRLPSYVMFNADAKLDTPSKTISIKNIIKGASNLKTYYTNNKVLPSTVTAGGITFTLAEFMYLMSRAIYQIGNSNTSDITYISGVSAPSSPTGDSLSIDLGRSGFIDLAKNVASYINTHKKAPNFANCNSKNIIYDELVDAFSRILSFYSISSRLPKYVTISTSGSSSSSNSGSISITGTGLNEKNYLSDLSNYLKSTKNCQITNKIKNKVSSITNGLTDDLKKAEAIFNYVKCHIMYSFYYNTKYGADGTLSGGKGNCVDQSHLLVAMFRSAGLAARYVHGTCKFNSGNTYGHVWTQVLIGDKWVVADATSLKNSLGNIYNWKTSSFTLKGTYSSLSF